MKTIFISLCVLAVALAAGPAAHSDEIQTHGKVCHNPSVPCASANRIFAPHDLAFKLPKELKWLTNYYSAPFFAILLKSRRAIPDPDGPAGVGECSGYASESERRKIQAMFPARKVFASRFGCGSPGVGYTNVNYDYNFIAVYGGETEAEARSFLATVKATKQFPDASIRKMQVLLDYGD